MLNKCGILDYFSHLAKIKTIRPEVYTFATQVITGSIKSACAILVATLDINSNDKPLTTNYSTPNPDIGYGQTGN